MRPLALGAMALLLASAARADELTRLEWKIDGTLREALVYFPARRDGAPLIVAFHGHGGNMRYSSRRYALHRLWPEAIVVYPQGLPTPTPNDRLGRRPGWSLVPTERNRDLLLFDAIVAQAKQEWKADAQRLFAMGHSNGGAFLYLLWGARAGLFAGLAPVAGMGERLLRGATPVPLLHIGGKDDRIVPYESQVQTVNAARKINGTVAPVEFVTEAGGHEYPDDASERIVAFFKKQRRSAAH